MSMAEVHQNDWEELMQAETVGGSEHSLYEDLIDPLFIPCPYWSDGYHKHQRGNQWVEEDFVRKHNHYDPNTGITHRDCEIYNTYSVTEFICVCGDRYQTRVSRGEAHYH